MAFGFGTHFCLGSHLARLEIRVMFEELLRRIPHWELVDPEEPKIVPGHVRPARTTVIRIRYQPSLNPAERSAPVQVLPKMAEGVFTWPNDDPQLIGTRCGQCGMVTFPTQDSCPRCASTDMEEMLLARRGTLWAWTTQAFPPPPPYAGPTGKDFVPFGVGYVELPGEVKVESHLTVCDPDVLTNGMDMELVIVPFRTDDDGNEVVTFAFRPVAGGGQS